MIGGYIPGEGRRAKRVGSLLVGYYDKRASELAQGREADAPLRRRRRLRPEGGADRSTHDASCEKRERPDSPFDVGAPTRAEGALAVWCEPELVCEVSWTEWTDEGTLRQPAFKGMRDDKDPREVVRES